jgi:lipoprotein signal peptidase
MDKKTKIIAAIAVIAIIAVVIYFYVRSKNNADKEVSTSTTSSTGLGNLLGNDNGGFFSSLLNGSKQA